MKSHYPAGFIFEEFLNYLYNVSKKLKLPLNVYTLLEPPEEDTPEIKLMN